MPKYIKKKDLKDAINECTWYHIGKNGDLVEGANSSDHEPLYKYSDIKKIIKGLPTIEAVSIDDYRSMENTCCKLHKALYEMADRKTDPNCSEKPNNSTCSILEQVEENCDTCGTPRHLCKYCIEEDRMWTSKKDEPQTDCKNCNNHDRCVYEPKDEPHTEERYTYQDEQDYNDRWKE